MVKENKKKLFVLLDTETTARNGLVFDFAYDVFDKSGYSFASKSLLFKDVMAIEEPFYKEKIANYWKLVEKGLIKPVSFRAARRHFNFMLQYFDGLGFDLIVAAYNASFDVGVLGNTTRALIGPDAKFLTLKVKLFDVMHGWAATCPKTYGKFAPFNQPKPGKKPTGNISTTAENVYRYESGNTNFSERHVAFEDVKIEKEILLKILKRKQKMHIVDNPKNFVGSPWKIVQERCAKYIKEREDHPSKLVQGVLGDIGSQIPDYTITKAHKAKMSLEDRETIEDYRIPLDLP
jgi:hypothetical protein